MQKESTNNRNSVNVNELQERRKTLVQAQSEARKEANDARVLVESGDVSAAEKAAVARNKVDTLQTAIASIDTQIERARQDEIQRQEKAEKQAKLEIVRGVVQRGSRAASELKAEAEKLDAAMKHFASRALVLQKELSEAVNEYRTTAADFADVSAGAMFDFFTSTAVRDELLESGVSADEMYAGLTLLERQQNPYVKDTSGLAFKDVMSELLLKAQSEPHRVVYAGAPSGETVPFESDAHGTAQKRDAARHKAAAAAKARDKAVDRILST